MTLAELLARVSANYPLNDILAALDHVPVGIQLQQSDVMALSHYVKRLGVPSSDPSIAKLVKFVNERFVQPMFDPSVSGASRYEPKSIVFGLERFPRPETVRAVLHELLADPSYATFLRLVRRYRERTTLAIIAALVARTPGDLVLEAGGAKPRETKLQRVWALVESIVEDSAQQPLKIGEAGPEPRRPLELRQDWSPGPTLPGWRQLREYLEHGVPYELLVLQRMIATPFGRAQSASSEQVAAYLSDLFLYNHLPAIGLPFLRTMDGPQGPYPPYVSKHVMERITGVVPSPDIAFVRPVGSLQCQWLGHVVDGYLEDPLEYRQEHIVAVIESKVASDGGTARQKCDELRRQFGAVAMRPGILAAALVDGSGWNQRRAEVARLALDIGGQIYRLSMAPALVEAIRSRC